MYATILTRRNDASLIYVYRRKKLAYDLSRPECLSFMRNLGYWGGCIDYIERLKERLMCHEDFPHEIGLFLGYPLGDVMGFIENKGRNALLCGCRKVYVNKAAAEKQFSMYQKCTRIYSRLFESGFDIERLVVKG